MAGDLSEVPLVALSIECKEVISTLLNPPKVIPSENGLPRDWRGLAHLSNLGGEVMPMLTGHPDPSTYIITFWQNKEKNVTIKDFQAVLEELDRWDILDDTSELFERDAEKYLKEVERSLTTANEIVNEVEENLLTRDDVLRVPQGLNNQNYDAFLLYADEDLNFATEMMNKLENEHKLKLCIKDRDLIAGITFEHVAVMRLISERCNRLIVIVTSNFLNSSANKFFLNYAQALSIDKCQRMIIPCLYEKCQLPPQLNYISTVDYTRVGLYDFWQKLRDSVQTPNRVTENFVKHNSKQPEPWQNPDHTKSTKEDIVECLPNSNDIVYDPKDNNNLKKISNSLQQFMKKLIPKPENHTKNYNQMTESVSLPSLQGLDQLNTSMNSVNKKPKKKFINKYMKKVSVKSERDFVARQPIKIGKSSIAFTPRTINKNMLINLIIEQGPKGEAGKLFFEDGINLEETKEIRIEFLNILKIDYLWVMPNLVKLKLSHNIIEKIENLDTLINLKELDLSFNHIDVMENLNCLTKLEILLLYNNKITKIENIDDLQNLTIFSIGNNLITDWEHALYLRKFKNLRSLNMDGNPCTKEIGYSEYIFANGKVLRRSISNYKTIMILVNCTYLHLFINSCLFRHVSRLLNTLEETEVKETEELSAQQEYEKKLAFLTTAYVEHLDGDYLFRQMFADDTEGKGLTMVTEDTQNVYAEYEKSFIVLCQEFCEFGLEEHQKRIDEINLFITAVNNGKKSSQDQGRLIVNDIITKKTELLLSIKPLLSKLHDDVDNVILEEITEKVQDLADDFNDLVTEGWSNLMSLEMDLHEQIVDINEVFRLNISDMVDTFLTAARGHFSQLRNREAEYNDTINGLILYYLSGFGDDAKIPSHLVDLCGDKDILATNLSNSHEKHLQAIDAREEIMLNRLKNWLENYIEQLVVGENERNNQQVLEISHFSDSQQKEFSSLKLLQRLNINISDVEAMEALGD
ncbi:dynein regulatory complex subunit 3 [Halictus rubicundus]|uniref:dynein regulatory complex subunit 3 n=1 Tax=Halictus rubicundus TaxID=77578 RepID=UPI004036448D